MKEKDESLFFQLPLQVRSELRQEVDDLSNRIFTYLTTIADLEETKDLLKNERISPQMLSEERFKALDGFIAYKKDNDIGSFNSFCDTMPGREGAILKQFLHCEKEPPEVEADFNLVLDQLYTNRVKLNYIDNLFEQVERVGDPNATFTPADADKFDAPFKAARPLERYDVPRLRRFGEEVLLQYQGMDRLYIASGFKIFDDKVHGYRRGGITTIAGRPGAGKTLWGTTSCAFELKNTNARVLFVSTEMSENDIMERIVLAAANMQKDTDAAKPLPVPLMKSGAENFVEYPQRWSEAVVRFAPFLCKENTDRFHLYAEDNITIEGIETRLMTLQARSPVDVVFIDYWQNIAGGNGRQEWERLQDIAKRLSSLAKKYDLAMVCLAQLRRGQSGKDGQTSHPSMDDIGGSDQLARLSVTVTCLSSYSANIDGLNVRFQAADIVKARHGTQALIQQKLAGDLALLYEEKEIAEWPKPEANKKGTGFAPVF